MVQILTIVAGVFVLGATLLLERRCLGKPAVVQPLVLCLLAGILLGEESTGLWLGISLQLLSIGQSHYANWVLSSVTAAGALLVLGLYDIHFVPGSATAMSILIVSILFGIGIDAVDRRMIRRSTTVAKKELDIWKTESGNDEFARHIYRSVVRGFAVGGAQSVAGVGLAVGAGYVMSHIAGVMIHPDVTAVVALTVPLFGVAVTLGTLSGGRFPFYAAIGVAISMGLWEVMP